jgi:hypothetical protein
VAFDEGRIQVISFANHNSKHRRAAGPHEMPRKRVLLVYGSPLAGKTQTVRQIMEPGDIAVDIDALWQALTLAPPYVKPDALKYNVFKLRDELLDQVRTRYGRWGTAYVVGGYPRIMERRRLAERLGATLLHIDADEDECLARVGKENRPEAWKDYVRQWWRDYEPEADPPG